MTSAASTAASNPLSTSRVVRVFISSTSRDFGAERDILPQARIFAAFLESDIAQVKLSWAG